MAAKNIYNQLGKGSSSEQERVIGKNTYKVRFGMIDPDELYLIPVDSKTGTGNPRFKTLHKSLLALNPSQGPLTEEDQVAIFTKDAPDLPDHIKPAVQGDMSRFHTKVRKKFNELTAGLERSGESQDDIIISWDGGVYEGNNRTVISRLLKAKGDSRFGRVRVMCLPQNVSPEDVFFMLARRHIVPPSRWESADQTDMLAALEASVAGGMEAGYTPDDVIKSMALDLGMGDRKIKTLLLARKYLGEYQTQSGDYRPEKFSIYLKVAGNHKLRKMLYPEVPDAKPDANGLGVYNEDLLPRFYKWVKEDKINGRQDVTNMTSDKVGLLVGKNNRYLKTIDEKGAEEAARLIQLDASAKTRNKPGISKLESALAEMRKADGMSMEKLKGNEEYLSELAKLRDQLDQEISRFKA